MQVVLNLRYGDKEGGVGVKRKREKGEKIGSEIKGKRKRQKGRERKRRRERERERERERRKALYLLFLTVDVLKYFLRMVLYTL